MSAPFHHLIEGVRFEYRVEAVDGVSLTTGEAWFGSYITYRREGTRRWSRFSIVDVHTWDIPRITAAIEFKEGKSHAA